jgi:hypothetical protein
MKECIMSKMNITNEILKMNGLRDLITNPYIISRAKIDWGKAVASANEDIHKSIFINKGINCESNEIENNAPGFDLYVGNKRRVQSKLRQVNGTTPFSTQIHFENTRRKSIKNNNGSSSTGHVTYAENESDIVLISLVHYSKNVDVVEIRKDISKWHWVAIPTHELKDKNNLGYLLPNIPSYLLFKYKLITDIDWKFAFEK